MKRTVYFIGIISILILCLLAGFKSSKSIEISSIQPEGKTLPVRDSVYIQSALKYNRTYSFIQYPFNTPEWKDSSALNKFFTALSRSDKRKAKVLHIGDSHVQADFFTGEIRDRIQQVFGAGGRGLIFPYASAGTHGTRDYRTYSNGIWKYAKNIQSLPELTIGLTGATIYTEDITAGFRFQFREGFIQEKDLILKIYCDKGPRSFDAQVIYPEGDTILVNCSSSTDGLPYVKVLLPRAPNDFSIRFTQNTEESSYFQCYGLSIENVSQQGVLYHSVGINGAGYTALLRQGLMPEQLKEINPDLVVIDLGANDFYPKIIDQPVFEENLKEIVRIIRGVCPGTSILVTCSQDIYCRKRNIAECKRFAAIARSVAFEMDCAFYDYYRISGGQYAMNKWYQNKLAKPDRVHLTAAGYAVKGELYFNAFLNAYLKWMKGERDSFVIPESLVASIVPAVKPGESTAPSGTAQKYTVRSGDNLGSIAQRYGVSVSQLKSWNGLKSDQIRIGQVLKLSVSVAPPKTVVEKPTTVQPKSIPQSGGASGSSTKIYTVKSGDTLWGIAQTHSCTVEQIKELNGISSSALKPGMKIKLP
jgi:LysM repeat protein